MNKFFRRLSLPSKLLMLILLPLIIIVYLTIQLYREKSDHASLLHSYLDRINRSVSISKLIADLQSERKISYNYALTRNGDLPAQIMKLRTATDTTLAKLTRHEDITLKEFANYTFLDSLGSMRNKIDKGFSADLVMHFYTTAIFRLHTLNIVLAGNNKYLDPLFADLTTGKILNEMVTYLEIISTNFYNALYSKQNNVAMLFGLMGVHDIYNSYEKELLVKASPEFIARYKTIRNTTELKPVVEYIDHVFKKFSFDTLYNTEEWAAISAIASSRLSALEKDILQNAQSRMQNILDHELRSRDITFFILGLALLIIFALLLYTTHIITKMLTGLSNASQKLARGVSGLNIKPFTNDVIGSLSLSISSIDENNKTLADAADAIGKGNFNVPIYPRSPEDTLGNAVVRMRDNLRQFEQRKDDFIKMASHELKTPVTTIKGYAQLLQLHTAEKDPFLTNSLSAIERQVAKLTKLITDLLDATKIETGQLTIKKEIFPISEIINPLENEVRAISRTHSLVINQHADPLIYADRDRISQVLSNLLENAIKYSPGGSQVIITAGLDRDSAIISFEDFGIGISKTDEEKIFERFYRATGKNEDTFPGFGIGLFIVKEIITLHKGRVWVKSEKGKGSTFFISLPIQH